MTTHELLTLATEKLKNKSTSPGLDAEVLLAFILKKSKLDIFVHMDRIVYSAQKRKFLKLLTKRAAGWPVAYLTYEKEFFGLKFYVNKNVLIPRPETEGLVELALEQIKDLRLKIKEKRPLQILDIGTGSGNIIVSLAYNLPASTRRLRRGGQLTTYNFFGSDISPKALAVARQNARRHKTRISFKQSNLLGGWANQHFDIIIANLPYLVKEIDPSTRFEPKQALIAKNQGLALYEKLFQQISTLAPHPSTLFLEIGHDQGQKIKNLASQWLPGYKCEISKDLAGRNRLAIVSRT